MADEATNLEPESIDDVTPDESAEEAVEAVEAAAVQVQEAVDPEGGEASLDLPNFEATNGAAAGDGDGMELLSDVSLRVKIELGRTQMYVEDVLRLNEDSVVELDKAAGDPVDIFVNDRHVARGEVLVVNDNFCVRVSEIIQPAGSEKATTD